MNNQNTSTLIITGQLVGVLRGRQMNLPALKVTMTADNAKAGPTSDGARTAFIAVSQADGHFEIQGIAHPGKYQLKIEQHPDWRLVSDSAVATVNISKEMLNAGRSFELKPISFVCIKQRRQLVVKVVDERGEGIEGVTVTLNPILTDDEPPFIERGFVDASTPTSTPAPSPNRVFMGKTGDDGTVEFDGLLADAYDLTSESPFSDSIQGWTLQDDLPIQIDLIDPHLPEPVVIHYQRDYYIIYGHVLGDDTQPLINVPVRLVGDGAFMTQSSFTDANGYYEFSVPAGHYAVLFNREVPNEDQDKDSWILTSTAVNPVEVSESHVQPASIDAVYTGDDCCRNQVEAIDNAGQAVAHGLDRVGLQVGQVGRVIGDGFSEIKTLNTTVHDGLWAIRDVMREAFLPEEPEVYEINFETLFGRLHDLEARARVAEEKLSLLQDDDGLRYPKLTLKASSMKMQMRDQRAALDQVRANIALLSNESRQNVDEQAQTIIDATTKTLDLIERAYPGIEPHEQIANRLRHDLPQLVHEEVMRHTFTIISNDDNA